jgi:hypothetical protein
MRTSLLILLALICVPAASGVGPWLGVATNGLGYNVSYGGNVTHIGALTVQGEWGIPRVTPPSDGGVGGLSTDGRTFVLAQQPHPDGEGVVSSSSFLVLHTKPLRVVRTITLRGDFGFDALSPRARTLYLIQHLVNQGTFRYRVRAYDLAQRRLLPGSIADKRQRDWLMAGYPVTRATTANGGWVYTLYASGNNYPFVHALDTVHRTAVCIGIPWNWASDQTAINSATLEIQGGKLSISGKFALDRATFKITKLSQ